MEEKLIMTNDAYGTVEVQAPPKKKSARFYATAAALCLGCAVAGYHAPAAVGKVLNLSSLPPPASSTRTRFESGDNGFCLGVRGAGKGKAGTDSSLTIWTCDKDSNEDSPQFMRYEEYASCPGCRNSGRLLYGPENTIDNKVYCVAVESRDKGSRFKLESCKDKGGQIFQRQDIIFDGRELRLTSLNLCMNFDKFEKDQEIFSASCSQSLSMGGWRMIGASNPQTPRPTPRPTDRPTPRPTPQPTYQPTQQGICNARCTSDNDCAFFGGESPCPVCDGRRCRAGVPVPPQTLCINEWKPVCGQTGKNGRELKTFDNFCFAEQAGVMFYVDGECDNLFDCKNDDDDEVSWSQSCIYANTATGKKRGRGVSFLWRYAGPNNNDLGDWKKCRDKGDSETFITKWCPWQDKMMDCAGRDGRCLRHNKDTGMFAYTDDGQWNSEKKCHDRNKPDTWNVKWCPDRRPTPKPTKQPTNNQGPCMGTHDPVCGRKGNQLKTYRNSGCAEGDGVYFYEEGTCDEVFDCGDENDEVSRSQSCIVANVGNDKKVWSAGPNNDLGTRDACRAKDNGANIITKWCPFQKDFMTCSPGRAGRCLRYNKDWGTFRFDVQNQWNSEQKCNNRGEPETWTVKWCPYMGALCNTNGDCGGDAPRCVRRSGKSSICWN